MCASKKSNPVHMRQSCPRPAALHDGAHVADGGFVAVRGGAAARCRAACAAGRGCCRSAPFGSPQRRAERWLRCAAAAGGGARGGGARRADGGEAEDAQVRGEALQGDRVRQGAIAAPFSVAEPARRQPASRQRRAMRRAGAARRPRHVRRPARARVRGFWLAAEWAVRSGRARAPLALAPGSWAGLLSRVGWSSVAGSPACFARAPSLGGARPG